MKTTLTLVSFLTAAGGTVAAAAYIAGAEAAGFANPVAWFAAFAGSFVLLTVWNDYGPQRTWSLPAKSAPVASLRPASEHALAA